MSQSFPDPSAPTKQARGIAPPTRVSEVMTRDVVTLQPQDSFGAAITLIARLRFRHILVVDGYSHLAGVVSDRDLLRCMTREPHADTVPMSEVMRTNLVTVRPDTLLSTAVAEMLTRRINCLPVIDEEQRVCGILTSTDLLRAFQQVQQQIEQAKQ
jgi:acetoin utilization protein AcuB